MASGHLHHEAVTLYYPIADGTKRARRFWKGVKILLSDDVPESQAKAAVLASDCDLTDCQLWILENQHDAALIERLAEEFDETFGELSAMLCTGTLSWTRVGGFQMFCLSVTPLSWNLCNFHIEAMHFILVQNYEWPFQCHVYLQNSCGENSPQRQICICIQPPPLNELLWLLVGRKAKFHTSSSCRVHTIIYLYSSFQFLSWLIWMACTKVRIKNTQMKQVLLKFQVTCWIERLKSLNLPSNGLARILFVMLSLDCKMIWQYLIMKWLCKTLLKQYVWDTWMKQWWESVFFSGKTYFTVTPQNIICHYPIGLNIQQIPTYNTCKWLTIGFKKRVTINVFLWNILPTNILLLQA